VSEYSPLLSSRYSQAPLQLCMTSSTSNCVNPPLMACSQRVTRVTHTQRQHCSNPARRAEACVCDCLKNIMLNVHAPDPWPSNTGSCLKACTRHSADTPAAVQAEHRTELLSVAVCRTVLHMIFCQPFFVRCVLQTSARGPRLHAYFLVGIAK
jgi:hypothetical protein